MSLLKLPSTQLFMISSSHLSIIRACLRPFLQWQATIPRRCCFDYR